MSKIETIDKVTAIKINQWYSEWDKVNYDPNEFQKHPSSCFYLFSMRAKYLKALTGVYRRSIKGGTPRVKDPNVQRGHEEERSEEIRDFVKYGYPWCEISEKKRISSKFDDLRKPGWLPTAIVVNILESGAKRNKVEISEKDRMQINENDIKVELIMPSKFSGADWEPETIYPLEVIDGQHRLWAFEEFDPGVDYELPVVAFHGLDRGWQAYLFWSINITPKRINKSLAFDLYPLLRQQTWLDAFSGHSIYRETRCQELVEALWAHPSSPWYQKINMLGEKKDQREYQGASVTQAAWIRSLMSSFVKQWDGRVKDVGGLFGAYQGKNGLVLPWTRPMQAAVLIYAGNAFKEAVKNSHNKWADNLRKIGDSSLGNKEDAAFYGEFSLITTDQGIRGFLFVINDLCYVCSEELNLMGWGWEECSKKKKGKIKEIENPNVVDENTIKLCIDSFKETKAAKFIEEFCCELSSYDWRTSATPNLEENIRKNQALFRGGSGYKEIRKQLVLHLSTKKGNVAIAAEKVKIVLGY